MPGAENLSDQLSINSHHLRTRIKICGITCPEDAASVVQLGADAIGLVFYPASPRYVDTYKAAMIAQNLAPFVCKVGLFVDATADEINTVLNTVPLDMLQFHGTESQEECARYSRPYIKAIRIPNDAHGNLSQISNHYAGASAILLDSYVKGLPGGTGKTFDWNKVPPNLNKPIILSGGLTAANVAAAIKQVKPFAVDVSSGVETRPGIKDAKKIEKFIQEVLHVR